MFLNYIGRLLEKKRPYLYMHARDLLVMSFPLEQGRLNLQVSSLVLLISALKLIYMFG